MNKPFYDLNQINKPCEPGFDLTTETISKCIIAQRFKPLLRDLYYRWSINGHYMFHKSGRTDYIQAGTT